MSRRFVYYKPNLVVDEANHALPGIKKFSYYFRMYNPGVVPVDRTNTIRLPVHVKSLYPLPTFRPINKTFEEICNERAVELLKHADALGEQLYTFWSGGIDSTLLLVSLLKNATPAQKENIMVLMTEESIAENPNFYRDHIQGRLRTDSSDSFSYLLGTRHILLDGEHNDQLFGSDIVASVMQKYGDEVIHTPYRRELFVDFFGGLIDDTAIASFYVDLFEKLFAAAPIPITTVYDGFWWINFALKWQTVNLRKLPFVAPRNAARVTPEYVATRHLHFYSTDDFQLWSMNNPDKKIKDSWKTYKWPCKDIIYDYTKDAEYRDNKIKRGSLYSLLLQQSQYNFIDESMTFHHELDAKEFYNPDNDFKDAPAVTPKVGA